MRKPVARLRTFPLNLGFTAVALAALAACGGSDDDPGPEPLRPQDSRMFVASTDTTFAALGNSTVTTNRWAGVLDGAHYQIEVPATWNGQLVMWAHGYAGTGPNLPASSIPIMRRYLIDNGYAWASSSYTKNYYDVRAGVEDTNHLALNFNALAATNGRTLAKPTKIFITGVSMGGHITAAAIDAEAATYANNKVKYAGAVPMCGVLGDTELFNYFGGYQVTAQQLAGIPITEYPQKRDFTTMIAPTLKSALWTSFPTATTPGVTNAQGDKLKNAVAYLSGGPRPFFEEGFANAGNQGNIFASLDSSDGTIRGILNDNVVDTTQLFYRIDLSMPPTPTPAEVAFNNAAFKITPTPDANRLRRDGLRWIPKTNGDISIPVVTLHTLGDLFVPFRMEQVFAARTKAKMTDKFLVQRAIRDVGHCAFTAAEATRAFDDMIKWEAGGPKPAGDDVTTPAVIASPTYGCTFTNNTPSAEDYTPPATRAAFQANYPSCPPTP